MGRNRLRAADMGVKGLIVAYHPLLDGNGSDLDDVLSGIVNPGSFHIEDEVGLVVHLTEGEITPRIKLVIDKFDVHLVDHSTKAAERLS